MPKSNIADLEYPALRHIAKAERRRSGVIYLTILLCVVFFFFVSFQLLQIDKHINDRITKLTQAQEQLVKKAQADSRTRTEEFRRYITCIFILPVELRTVQNQLFCFQKSDLPGGRKESEFVPVEFNPSDAAVATLPDVTPSRTPQQGSSASSSGASSSSSNNTPAPQPSVSGNSQPASEPTPAPQPSGVTIDLPILPAIRIPSPF